MNVRHSTATPINQYQLTIIESGLLLSRLAREIEFLKNELRRASAEFRKDPKYFTSHALHELSEHSRAAISKPHAIPGKAPDPPPNRPGAAVAVVTANQGLLKLVSSRRLRRFSPPYQRRRL